MHRRSENYLRTYRKQSGLTQREVAFLLGKKNGGPVSRYERRHRLPPLDTALACEVIFKVPIAELFVGVHKEVAKDVAKRRIELREILTAKGENPRRANVVHHKVRWLDGEKVRSSADHVASTL